MSNLREYYSQPPSHNSHSSCSWRLIQKGLNIEGRCTNPHCLAFNQMTIINLGFGEYDFSRIILTRKNRCPICKTIINPTKYALNECQWWYVNHYDTQTFPLNTVYNTYDLHDLDCEYLVMEIMPLPFHTPKPTNSQEVICPICLINTEDDYEIVQLHCLHTFHSTCINRWLRSNALMANTCPMCRTHIAE